MNYGISTLGRFELKWNFLKFRIKRYFEKQVRIDINKYVQDIVVIHMKKRKDRYRQMKWESKRIKLSDGNFWDKIRIHDGLDGKLLKVRQTKDFNPFYDFKSHYEVDPHPQWKDKKNQKKIKCSNAEIGCTISHLQVWKDIVKKKTPYTLILEDDFFFDRNFQEKFIQSWFEVPGNFDLFYLSIYPSAHGFTWDTYSENIIELHNGVWWLSGYILSYEGAKKLIDNFPVCGPGDMWINHQFKNMSVYATKFNLIGQRPDTTSDNIYSFESIYKYWKD